MFPCLDSGFSPTLDKGIFSCPDSCFIQPGQLFISMSGKVYFLIRTVFYCPARVYFLIRTVFYCPARVYLHSLP